MVRANGFGRRLWREPEATEIVIARSSRARRTRENILQRTLQVTDAGGAPLAARATLDYEDWDFEPGQLEVDVGADGALAYDDDQIQTARLVVAVPKQPGFWTGCAPHFDEVEGIVCPAISEAGHSWWHQLLGLALEDDRRGAGLRLGVIDLGFDPDAGLQSVEILRALDSERPKPPERWSHGEAVCRILGDQAAPEACAPIAPGAQLVFANAVFTRATQEDEDFTFPLGEGDAAEYLDPRLVAHFIYEMAFNAEVDLINLSLGAFDLPDEAGAGLKEAIEAAVDAGVTVICAAGNQPIDHAAFPASLKTCVGVGAFGAEGWAPEGSMPRWCADEYPNQGRGALKGEAVFFWFDSAYGAGVDVIGPGVGILIAGDGAPSFDLTGTSFAAPIVTGLLAVELARDDDYVGMARDKDRAAYAKRRLLGLARKTGMAPRYERAGAISLDAAHF
jgi:subtilisin family serine protease